MKINNKKKKKNRFQEKQFYSFLGFLISNFGLELVTVLIWAPLVDGCYLEGPAAAGVGPNPIVSRMAVPGLVGKNRSPSYRFSLKF